MNQHPLSVLNTGTRSRVTISVNVARHRGVLVEGPRWRGRYCADRASGSAADVNRHEAVACAHVGNTIASQPGASSCKL